MCPQKLSAAVGVLFYCTMHVLGLLVGKEAPIMMPNDIDHDSSFLPTLHLCLHRSDVASRSWRGLAGRCSPACTPPASL